jgi:hypothetical protein
LNWKILTLIGIAVALAHGDEAYANSSSGTATASIADPTSVTVMSDLAFGTIVPAALPGTVIITPANVRSKTGALTLVSSLSHPALFNLTGTAGRTYSITLPVNNTVRISTPAPAFMTVQSFSSDATGGSRSFDANGKASFNVGGVLEVRANQATGIYSGTFAVNVIFN